MGWMVSLTLWPLYLWGKGYRYALSRMLGGPRVFLDVSEKRKMSRLLR